MNVAVIVVGLLFRFMQHCLDSDIRPKTSLFESVHGILGKNR